VYGLSPRKRPKEREANQKISLSNTLSCKKAPLKGLKENHDIKHSVQKGGVCYHVITCNGLYVQQRRYLIVQKNILSEISMTASTTESWRSFRKAAERHESALKPQTKVTFEL
jgi:hypothetical protein